MTTSIASQSVEPRDGLLVKITETLAEHRGVDPLELPLLAEGVDFDALENLFRRSDPGTNDVVVTLRVGADRIRVQGNGEVAVERARAPEPGTSLTEEAQ